MSLNIKEAIAVQALIDWVVNLNLWEGSLESPTDNDVIDAVQLLNASAHKTLGAGPGMTHVMGGLMRVFPR